MNVLDFIAAWSLEPHNGTSAVAVGFKLLRMRLC